MLDDLVETKTRKDQAVDRIGGSLVNIILGALILWVGQTTFRHAGLLASVNGRFDSVEHQFEAVDSRHESLRQRVEQVTSNTNERTRSRFTREDGEKLALRIKELSELQTLLERQLTDRVTSLQLKLIALETHGSNYQEVAMLRAEVEHLRSQSPKFANAPRQGYVPPQNSASSPIQLPPVTQRR